jgi:hypothetical protein
MVLHGVAWCCMVVAWCCVVLHGVAWCCRVLQGVAWCCMVCGTGGCNNTVGVATAMCADVSVVKLGVSPAVSLVMPQMPQDPAAA